VSGRVINLNVKDLISAQAALAREHEVRQADEAVHDLEYGLRNFIPPSLTDSDEYWHTVATKCFAISSQFGCPTFFLTFAMNPHWPDYRALNRNSGNFAHSAVMAIVFKSKLSALMKCLQDRKILGVIHAFVWRVEYQKRGLPHAHILLWTDFNTQDVDAVDSVVNVRYPKESPFVDDRQMVTDLRCLIEAYQGHQHSRRCRSPEGECRFGYPQPEASRTTVRGRRFVLAREASSRNVVPHNPLLLSEFRCHHCLEVIHSEQAIGYVLKYCTKNSDAGEVLMERVRFEGREVTREQRLEYHAARRIASASECFAGISGFGGTI
jgi:hypothetical protein